MNLKEAIEVQKLLKNSAQISSITKYANLINMP